MYITHGGFQFGIIGIRIVNIKMLYTKQSVEANQNFDQELKTHQRDQQNLPVVFDPLDQLGSEGS